MYLQYSPPPPLFITFCQMFGRHRTPWARLIFVDVLYWPPYSMNKFISYDVPGPLQWFFHFNEEIVIAWTQENMTTHGGTEPHNFSWQCKESHCCRCYRPPYSPNMNPWDYNFFAKVKEPLWETRYNTRDKLIHAMGSQCGISTKIDALMV